MCIRGRRSALLLGALLALCVAPPAGASRQAGANLLPDPSIEQTQPKNRWGSPYVLWSGWVFEGAPEFRVGKVARTGKSSAEIVGSQGGKIRLYAPSVTLDPGTYRFSCYVRGLDIGPGVWGTCEDVNLADDQYVPLKLMGTFGWTKLTIVKRLVARQEVQARIGLWGPGRLWVDDAELVRVPDGTSLTTGVEVGKPEGGIAPPGSLDPAAAVRCLECGYRNMPAWGRCYACGELLVAAQGARPTGPPSRLLASFEDGKLAPFAAGEGDCAHIATEHATDGRYALKLDKSWVTWDGPQDWTGYDYVEADAYNTADEPVQLYFEVQDLATTDYWTRVNYTTVLPPGASTLVVPTDLYVGEKSRPGRPLDRAHIKRLALNIGDAKAPVYFDNLRLERDLSDKVHVPGLMAFSFGPGTSQPMRGFVAVTPATQYSPGRGYGLVNAQVWRAFDALQPEPLYANFMCITAGGFAVDVPDGRYHVFINLDSPSGFWGEYQIYRDRVVKANGVEVVHDRMDLESFRRRYFRFADTEDSPLENTFDKYQRPYFQEKEFDVDVAGGKLTLEFQGTEWSNCVSALVVYPASQAAAGRAYLDNLRERRRFAFDNYFKRVLPNGNRDARGPIPDYAPTAQEQARGYVLFSRDWMLDVPVNAVPRREEVTRKLSLFASAGQMEPIVFSLAPLRDLGPVTVSVSDLVSPAGRVPASAVSLGVVSHRITRVTTEGTVYTVSPRLIMPRSGATLRKGVTTTFWLTLRTPRTVRPGTYRGRIRLALASGKTDTIAVEARLFATPLAELDVPAGPWGSTIDIPWFGEDTGDYNRQMFRKCLARMRDYGCTTFTGIPSLQLRGWKDGKPDIDFSVGDRQMADARSAGFKSTLVNYNGGVVGFDNYFVDEGAMRAGGFTKYTDFLRAVLAAVDEHAKAAGWLPVAYNLCDEPLGDAAARSAANAQAWREAAPATMLTTGATSIESPKPDNPHLPLVKALKVPDLNGHDEAAIKVIHDAGNGWAFYNGGNRWTFGTYMFKCAQQYGMKFRLSWHWNASAGDPYYALDCREDDYAWCVANANGDLIPAITFDRDIRAGIDDYRYMLTLSRLVKAHPNHPAAASARKLLADKLASFKLGERDHDAKWPTGEYRAYRLKLAEAIERLSAPASARR